MRRPSDFFTAKNILAAAMLLVGALLIIRNWSAVMGLPAGAPEGQSPEDTSQQSRQVETPATPKAMLTVVERLIPTQPPTPSPSSFPSPLPSHPPKLGGTEGDAPPSAIPPSLPTPALRQAPGPLAQGQRAQDAASPQQAEELTPSPSQEAQASLFSTRERFGIGVALPPVDQYDAGRLGAGWYVAWRVTPDTLLPNGMEFVQMVRLAGGSYRPDIDTIGAAADANPGSLWIIGNEPDVLWQDNATPTEYAQVYHDLYTFLKDRDPSCRVAIGGISQPTPLRLEYLDMILETYQRLYDQKMPVDAWNIHAFILREERDSWGIDIPPGISDDTGVLYEIEDHDDLELFKRQIVDFRRWMEERDERRKPLIVSEYGILMPADYGFPYEAVRDFMYETFDYFLTAADESLGYPADGNRLVQRWAWYSLSDRLYPTSNLFDPETKEITPLGIDYQKYVEGLLAP